MIVIIQCAARKPGDAGHLVTDACKPVDVVAHPQAAPADASRIYARPDDPSDHGVSWRQVLLDYNRRPDGNPLGLYAAYQLYEEKVYVRLAERFGLENVFILSAGWGLIRADFLTPYYNITFSPSAEDYMRRRKTDQYDDFRMLPADTKDDIVFFGGKDYLSLFCWAPRKIPLAKSPRI